MTDMNVEFCFDPESADKYPAKQHAQLTAKYLSVDEGFIYLQGSPSSPLEDSDQPVPFRQRRYFYYCSGVDEPECHIIYNIKTDTLTLYIPTHTERDIIYNGEGLTKEEARRLYDVDQVKFVDRLIPDVISWRDEQTSPDSKFYALHPSQAIYFDPADGRLDSRKLIVAMNTARVIKDVFEIDLIKKANDVSAHAHTEVLKTISKATNERDVEATFIAACIRAGAKHQSYSPIAAAGVNAAVLHYENNCAPITDQWMMVLDAGADWNCYASDVTRTIPLRCGTKSGSGFPDTKAKEIYDVVQEMQDGAISCLEPGTVYRDLDVMSHLTLVKGLLRLGILKGGDAEEILKAGISRLFCPHGLGHHVGLEVHDVYSRELLYGPSTVEKGRKKSWTMRRYDERGVDGGQMLWTLDDMRSISRTIRHYDARHDTLCTDEQGLREGMVLTVEPGCYFNPYLLDHAFKTDMPAARYIDKATLKKYMPVGGVRIEDDLLITSNGYRNLTMAPKGEEAMRIIAEHSQKAGRIQGHCTGR